MKSVKLENVEQISLEYNYGIIICPLNTTNYRNIKKSFCQGFLIIRNIYEAFTNNQVA